MPGLLGHLRALTNWNREEALLWDYYEKPCDAYSVQIMACHPITPPVAFPGIARTRGRVGEVRRRKERLFMPSGLPIFPQGGESQRAAEAFAGGDLQGVPALWLPFPILSLVLARKWTSLVLAAAWGRSLADALRWPEAQWFADLGPAIGASLQPAPARTIGAHDLARVAHLLRSLAPQALLNAREQQGPEPAHELQLEFTKAVSTIDGLCSQLQSNHTTRAGFGGQQYRTATTIRALLLSADVRDRSRLAKVVASSIDLVLGEGGIGEAMCEAIQKGRLALPSAAHLCRAQLHLDMSYILSWRKAPRPHEAAVYRA